MQISVGIIMDPIGSIQYKKDSSLAMLWAAQRRGWKLYYMEQSDLSLQGSEAYARMAPLEVFEDASAWYRLGEYEPKPLAELNVILMRKDPPFDMEYIYTTYLLEHAERHGTLVVNRAASLRDANEKLFTSYFPQCITPMLVCRNKRQLNEFITEHQQVILKPLDGMGGASIFKVVDGDPNRSVIIETLTQHGTQMVMAQKFIPEISAGDKRIILIDGEPVPYGLARIPAQGELRGNLAAGGRGEVVELNERDRWICKQIGDELRRRGLIFVGIDVIGDYLTEINVTSPTCIREIDSSKGTDIAGSLMNAIERRLVSAS